MGRIFYDFDTYDQVLDMEIAAAMAATDGRIQTNAKKAIVDEAEKSVYGTYTPRVDFRRHGDGGILDPSTYNATNSLRAHRITSLDVTTSGNAGSGKGFTLYISADAQWQQLLGGNPSSNPDTLVEAIEKNGLYGAHPRPYMNAAEYNYAYWDGSFEKDLVAELEDAGL